jgi:hypothetical protein
LRRVSTCTPLSCATQLESSSSCTPLPLRERSPRVARWERGWRRSRRRRRITLSPTPPPSRGRGFEAVHLSHCATQPASRFQLYTSLPARPNLRRVSTCTPLSCATQLESSSSCTPLPLRDPNSTEFQLYTSSLRDPICVEFQLYTSPLAGEVAARSAAGEGMAAKPPTSSDHPSPVKGRGFENASLGLNANWVSASSQAGTDASL